MALNLSRLDLATLYDRDPECGYSWEQVLDDSFFP